MFGRWGWCFSKQRDTQKLSTWMFLAGNIWSLSRKHSRRVKLRACKEGYVSSKINDFRASLSNARAMACLNIKMVFKCSKLRSGSAFPPRKFEYTCPHRCSRLLSQCAGFRNGLNHEHASCRRPCAAWGGLEPHTVAVSHPATLVKYRLGHDNKKINKQ